MDKCQITTRIQPRGSLRGRDYSIITDNPEMVWNQWRKIGITDGAKQALKCADLKRDGKQSDLFRVTFKGIKCIAQMTRWDL